MSISQHEAVSLLNKTVFRPGWEIIARPVPGDSDQVLIGIEIKTVDSSFVTRGGEYQVPLTERALVRVDARDYATPEVLLYRLLGFVRELQDHEDREFLRTWDSVAERWVAPLHGHTPEGVQAWDRLQVLPQPTITRIGISGDAPWLAEEAGCEYVCWAEDDNKKRAAHGRTVNAGCDMEEDRGDCWESGNGKRAIAEAAGTVPTVMPERVVHMADPCNEAEDQQTSDCNEDINGAVQLASPCNEQTDDDQDEGPQRVLVHVGANCYEASEPGCNHASD
jgi:hypothetical protein